MTAEETTIDRLLDRTLVPGYSTIGYHLRRRGWDADDPAAGSLLGRTALVTGAGSGLGEATALGLARLGARVRMVVRSAERAAPAQSRIRGALAAEGITGADVALDLCDLSDLGDVRRYAAEVLERGQHVDVLVHNAGALPAERTESVDGHEVSVATHVLGPVLLTELLRPVLREQGADAGARVVLVSSGGMYAQQLAVEDPEYREGKYSGATAYARSKRMQVAITPVLQERLASDGISVHAMHPGWADTPGVADSLPIFRALTRPILRDAAGGADTIIWLAATQPAPEGGRFWHDRVERPTSYRSSTAETPAEREQFWAWVREQVQLPA